jgi:hypothetical protein
MKRDELRAAGWRSVEDGDIPPLNQTVEFARDEQVWRQENFLARWSSFNPYFNIYGLWWREV